MARRKIIHLDDERKPGHYACKHSAKPDKDRLTKEEDKVTCKLCKKMLAGGEGVVEHKYENSIGKILAMMTLNYSIAEIAKTLNLSQNTIYKYHDKHRAEEDKQNFEHNMDATKILEQKKRIIGDTLKHFLELQKDPKASKNHIIDAGSKVMNQIGEYEKTSNRLGYIGGETTTHEITGHVSSIAAAGDLVAKELEKEEMERREQLRMKKKEQEKSQNKE